jgi:hypothetical protein
MPLEIRNFGTMALVGEEEASSALNIVDTTDIPDIDTAIGRTGSENTDVERRPSNFEDLN